MDLLTNAIDSLRMGVEDYQAGSHSRLLTAVRNIHAGILLLYKEALRRLSPDGSGEVLVKTRMVPKKDASGKVYFTGEGTKTVDIQQIQERFKGLGISTDWVRFDQITRVRNEIEHYYTKANQKALEGVISNAFIITRDFLAIELKEEPLATLGEETWDAMLGVSEVYEAERAECQKLLAAVEWESSPLAEGITKLSCPACGANLLRPVGNNATYDADMQLQCRGCGTTVDADTFVPNAVEAALKWDVYLAKTDGGETPYTTCPECGAEAYIMDEERCARCGESVEHTCARCGNEIPAEELSLTPYCGWCEHMMNKDD